MAIIVNIILYDDIDDMWDFFQATLQYCLDQYVPFKKVYCKYSRRPTPWLTPELFATINDKQKAKVHAERTRDPSDFEQYRRLKNKLKM